MNEDKILVTLYDKDKNEIIYQVDRIFELEPNGQKCVAVTPKDGGEIIFLYCEIKEHENKAELIVSDIESTLSYQLAALTYKNILMEEALLQAEEEKDETADFIVITNKNGEDEEFLVHKIFEDETAKRTYAAVQQVKKDGELDENIYLYRFRENENASSLDMITSDMEFERVKALFLSLIS